MDRYLEASWMSEVVIPWFNLKFGKSSLGAHPFHYKNKSLGENSGKDDPRNDQSKAPRKISQKHR